MPDRKKHIFILALQIFLVYSLAFSQQVLDRVAAIVDDDVILESEITQGTYVLAMQLGIDPQKEPEKVKDLRKTVLDNFINEKLLLIKAEKDTILADEKTVESMLDQQIQTMQAQLGSEEALEEYFNMPISKIRRNYRKDIENNIRARMVREQKDMGVKISRREVINFYNSKKDSLPQQQEGVDISHILIIPKPGKEAKKKAREKIEIIQEKLKSGEKFADLARDFSDDPGSAKKGGDLGFVQRGDFVREFEQVAFSLKPGEISDIVESQYGFHIIQMIERRGEKIHVRHILASLPKTDEDENFALTKIQAVYKKLQEGMNFEELARKVSDDESTKEQDGHLGFFELNQLQKTAPEFVPQAQKLNPGEFSKPFRTKYGFHVLKLNSRKKARSLDLENDWDQIEAYALQWKRQKEYLKWIKELKKDVYIEVKPIS